MLFTVGMVRGFFWLRYVNGRIEIKVIFYYLLIIMIMKIVHKVSLIVVLHV